MRILALALKDLKQLFQNRMTAFFLVIMPVLFTVMFGFMFGGVSSGDEEVDPRLPVAVLDRDQSSFSQTFIELMDASTTVRLVVDDEADEDELRARVQQGDLAGAVIVPVGFEAQLLAQELPSITVVEDEDALSANAAVENTVRTAYNRLYNAALAAGFSQQAYLENSSFASEAEQRAYFTTGVELALQAWETPPVQTQVTMTISEAEEDPGMFGGNPYAHSSPGMMAQFAIAGLIGAAELLVAERRSRTMSRMLTTRISRAEVLIGHYLAIFVMIFLQLVVLAGFGQLFLKLAYFGRPLATLVVITASALATGAVGLLVGALARTSDQAVIFSLVPMFVFAGLGGAWVPLEFTNETVQVISKFTPVAWTMQGLQDILLSEAGVGEVWPAGLALLGFTVVFFGLAVWRFRFEGE
jgi:ABC-2 type transport system permease protein